MPPDDLSDSPADEHRRHQAEVDPDLLAPQSRSARPRHGPAVLAALAAGGVAGTAARYWLSRIIHVAPGSFPWSTFTINVTGSFLLGVLLTCIVERWPPSRYLRPFGTIGFLGAYTTFSTYAVEATVLTKDGSWQIAAVYVIGSLFCGLAAVYAGIVSARSWPLRGGSV